MRNLEVGREHVKITKKAYKFQMKLHTGWKTANSLRKSAARGSSEMGVTRKDPRSISHRDGKKEELAKTRDNQRA